MTQATAELKGAEQLPTSLETADQDGVVYVTHYPLTSAAASLQDLKAIRGLICAFVVKGEQTPLLCVYWRSRDEFERDEQVLLAKFPTKRPEEARHGFMSGFVSTRKRWRWRDIVTTIFAILGVWQTLVLLYRNAYQPGEVLVTVGRAGAINYFPEQQLIESFRITSRLPIKQSVLVKEVVLQRGDAQIRNAMFTPNVVNGLGTDQSETVQVSVALPEQPGDYQIVATTQSRAGWLPLQPKLQSYTMPVRIWSPVPRAAFEGWSEVQSDVATARFRLEVGYAAPSGLDCTMTVTNAPPDIIAIIPRMAGARASEMISAGEKDFRVVSQSWSTRAFPDFATTTIPIVLHAATSVDWQRLPTNCLQLICSPRTEPAKDV